MKLPAPTKNAAAAMEPPAQPKKAGGGLRPSEKDSYGSIYI